MTSLPSAPSRSEEECWCSIELCDWLVLAMLFNRALRLAGLGRAGLYPSPIGWYGSWWLMSLATASVEAELCLNVDANASVCYAVLFSLRTGLLH